MVLVLQFLSWRNKEDNKLKLTQSLLRRHGPHLSVLFVLSSVYILVACSTSQPRETAPLPAANIAENPATTMTTTEQPPTVLSIASAVSTSIYTPEPTSTYPPPAAGTKEAAMTAVAENRNARRTAIALTHEPTRTPGPPPIEPTETPLMGLDGCASESAHKMICINAWRGVINGEIVELRAGLKGSDEQLDPTWGMISVSGWLDTRPETYNTPQRLGAVRIVAVNGLLFTLSPLDLNTPGARLTPWATTTPGITFVFDLATRQWVSPPPSPSITPPLSPIPSPSMPPLLTVTPALSPLPSPSPSP